MKKLQRDFYPGSNWIYYKIYLNPTFSNQLLSNTLYPFLTSLYKKGLCSKWFFIRYSDPDYHIRVRILTYKEAAIGNIITLFHKRISKLIQEGYIDKIMIDTYNRELERYGKRYMSPTESIFFRDSESVCQILHLIPTTKQDYLWKAAILSIDKYLTLFGFDIVKKHDFTEKMSNYYKNEFSFNMHNVKSLNDIYRKYKDVIFALFDTSNDAVINTTKQILDKRNTSIIAELEHFSLEKFNISSIIHMNINRIFPVKQRLYELAIYTMLEKYYKSLLYMNK